MKSSSSTAVLIKLHKFDRNIRFTYDCFEDAVPYFLDIEIDPDGLSNYRKELFTGL